MDRFRSEYHRNPIKSDEMQWKSVIFYRDSRWIRQSESNCKESDNFSAGFDRNFLPPIGSDREGLI